jgi:hypothetical protein
MRAKRSCEFMKITSNTLSNFNASVHNASVHNGGTGFAGAQRVINQEGSLQPLTAMAYASKPGINTPVPTLDCSFPVQTSSVTSNSSQAVAVSTPFINFFSSKAIPNTFALHHSLLISCLDINYQEGNTPTVIQYFGKLVSLIFSLSDEKLVAELCGNIWNSFTEIERKVSSSRFHCLYVFCVHIN